MTNSDSHTYAIVPAAGSSRRMGKPKLLLPWPTEVDPNGTLIDAVLSAWTKSDVRHTVVVIRADDDLLEAACRAWPVTIVRPPLPPSDMKASIQFGLRYIASTWSPSKADRCFVAPADLPGLSTPLIDQLLQTEFDTGKIVLPRFGNKAGHPVLIPWSIAQEIFKLEEGEGVDRIVARHEKHEVFFSAASVFHDIDTPEQYRIALEQRLR